MNYMVASAFCLLMPAPRMSFPAPTLEELCSWSKSGCSVGFSVLLQVGCEGDGIQQSLVPIPLFVLKPCSVTLHILLLPGREQNLIC